MGKGKSLCIKFRKFFEKEKAYFVAETARCNKVDFGYKCNIAGGADIDKSAIGSRTSIGRYTTVRNCNIGKYCSISWNCSLGAKSHPYAHASGNAAFFQARFGLVDSNKKEIAGETLTTNIGNDVWIGCDVVIISGITVGDGAIIGAGAVVTKDVEPYSIVVGVPAKHYKYRFEEQIRKNLLESKWWDWEDELIIENIALFQGNMSFEISEKMVELAKQRKWQ